MTDLLWTLALSGLDLLLPVIIAVVGLAIGWVAVRFHKLTGIEIDAKHRQALQSALANGIQYAIQLLRDRHRPLTSAELTRTAADYVRKSVPDAVKHFRIGDEKLVDLLLPKIPTLTEEQARAATGHTGPIENRAGSAPAPSR